MTAPICTGRSAPDNLQAFHVWLDSGPFLVSPRKCIDYRLAAALPYAILAERLHQRRPLTARHNLTLKKVEFLQRQFFQCPPRQAHSIVWLKGPYALFQSMIRTGNLQCHLIFARDLLITSLFSQAYLGLSSPDCAGSGFELEAEVLVEDLISFEEVDLPGVVEG